MVVSFQFLMTGNSSMSAREHGAPGVDGGHEKLALAQLT